MMIFFLSENSESRTKHSNSSSVFVKHNQNIPAYPRGKYTPQSGQCSETHLTLAEAHLQISIQIKNFAAKVPDQHMKHTSSSANSRLLNRSEIIPGIPCHILLEASNSFRKKCTVTCEQSQLRSQLLPFTVNFLTSMPSRHCHRVPCQTHPNSRLTQSTTSPSRECMLDQLTLCHIPERDQGVQNNTATSLDFPFWLCALPWKNAFLLNHI